MNIRIIVDGPGARHVEHVANADKLREIIAETGQAMSIYRRVYPDAPPFEQTVKVEEA